MNKYQEAINYLWKSYDENKIYGIASRGYLEMLQELVDKETPKKPIEIQDDIFGDYHLVCPNCGQGGIIIATRTDGKLYPRCPFCGQKLEGEKEDDCYRNV